MSEDDKAPSEEVPPLRAGIDPYPILGDILGRFEAMIQTNGEVTAMLLQLVAANNLLTPELDAAAKRMFASYQDYWDFKRQQLGMPGGDRG
jgi:hypothetical protein